MDAIICPPDPIKNESEEDAKAAPHPQIIFPFPNFEGLEDFRPASIFLN
jgi:hypothetical protein